MALLEATGRLGNFQGLLKPWIPSSTAVRWRTRKPNIQRPIPDHYVKARYRAALEPIYPDESTKPWYEKCGNVSKINQNKDEKETKYEQLLAKLFHEKFADSQVIAIFQENPTKAHDQIKIKQMLHGHNMVMAYGSKKVATLALVGTEFEPVLKLHMTGTVYLCSKDLQIPKLLKFTKKMNTYILLGGVVQGRLVTKNQLQWCAKLPDIDTLRAELCHILSSSVSQLSQCLTHQQQSLSQSLDQHANKNTVP